MSVSARSTTRRTMPPGKTSGDVGVASWAKTPVASPKISTAASAIKTPTPVIRHMVASSLAGAREVAGRTVPAQNGATPR